MRKSIAVILAVFMVTCCIFGNDSNEKKSVSVDEQIATLKDSIRKLNAENYKKEADELTKKADYEANKGHTKLAEAYKRCAEANMKIADGYVQNKQKLIDSANEELFNATQNLRIVKKEFNEQMNDIKAKFQDIADKYENITKEYMAKAKVAHKKGDKDLYLIYDECASAQKKISEGVSETIDGRSDYIKAVDEYNKLKPAEKMIVSKLEIPKDDADIKKLADKLVADSLNFANEAKQAMQQSNAQKAITCNQIADAKGKEAAGIEKIVSGREAFKRANLKLEKYNQK